MADEERRNLVVVASAGYPEEVLDTFRPYPVDAPLPHPEAWRTGELILIDSPIRLGARFPRLADMPATGAAAWAVAPFASEGHRCVIGLSFARQTAFLADDHAYLTQLGQRAARAVALIPRAWTPAWP
jgi:GAF domain